ncbi:MAG: helix-turn-helix transcriptional regulator [Chloroflexi bacterium]|nr:helix-turn-helix transcriptional regulator [Chloroflexota bacterium]OJV97140.1 MAG: hypothetical protein BGO39_19330 [Chloroflexi bacterium 54-19]
MDTISNSPILGSTCPYRQVVDLLSNKWSILVMHLLKGGPRRFVFLQRHITGLSQKMLTQTLRELERNGLVKRTVYAEVPPRVEYELTPLGQTMQEPIAAILSWSRQNLTALIDAQERYDGQTGAGTPAAN